MFPYHLQLISQIDGDLFKRQTPSYCLYFILPIIFDLLCDLRLGGLIVDFLMIKQFYIIVSFCIILKTHPVSLPTSNSEFTGTGNLAALRWGSDHPRP